MLWEIVNVGGDDYRCNLAFLLNPVASTGKAQTHEFVRTCRHAWGTQEQKTALGTRTLVDLS
jgi:hypothetical protein